MFHVKKLCIRCRRHPRRAGQRWCNPCFAAYMRAHRPAYAALSVEARHRHRVRKRTLMQQARGTRPRGPCARCGAVVAQNHHPDYNRPEWVVRLCRACHRAEHPAARAYPPATGMGRRRATRPEVPRSGARTTATPPRPVETPPAGAYTVGLAREATP